MSSSSSRPPAPKAPAQNRRHPMPGAGSRAAPSSAARRPLLPGRPWPAGGCGGPPLLLVHGCATRKLTLPVLAIGGAESGRTGPGDAMKLAADNVPTVVLPNCGDFVAEEAPQEMLATLIPFLTA